MRQQFGRDGRSLFVWLLTTLFILRAAIPAGFMPVFNADGGGSFKIVICSANGAHTIDVDLGDASKPTPDQQASTDAPCAFAGIGSVALIAPEPLNGLSMSHASVDAARRFHQTALPPARAGPAHGSRAPPHLT